MSDARACGRSAGRLVDGADQIGQPCVPDGPGGGWPATSLVVSRARNAHGQACLFDRDSFIGELGHELEPSFWGTTSSMAATALRKILTSFSSSAIRSLAAARAADSTAADVGALIPRPVRSCERQRCRARLGDAERCCNLPHAPPRLNKIQSLTAERSRIRLGHYAGLLWRYQARSQQPSPENQGKIKTRGGSPPRDR